MKVLTISFFLKIFIFIFCLVIIDFSLGSLFDFFYFKMNSGENSRTTYTINKSKEPLIIFGSSRANHHYNPEILKNELKMVAYNAGKDGQSILYNYALLQSISERSKIQVIILELDMDEFNYSENTYNRLSSLLPYYSTNEYIDEIVNLKSPFEKYKAFSRLYRYNSLPLSIAWNSLFKNREFKNENGFIPLVGILDKPIQLMENPKSVSVDTLKVKYFRSFISRAKEINAKVFVFVSPMFLKFNSPNTFQKASKICVELNVPFKDFTQDSIFLNHREYFKDELHLNSEGATIYTKLISNEIKKHKIISPSVN
jgi:hypothetical protein